MPYETAGLVDNSLSIIGTMGGAAAIRASQLAAFPKFNLPTVPELPANSLHGTRYTRKVLLQMENNLKTGRPDFHGFPRIVDNYAGLGKMELVKGQDGLTRGCVEKFFFQHSRSFAQALFKKAKGCAYRCFRN